jgi:hypothetical protein
MIERRRLPYSVLFGVNVATSLVLTNAVFALALWTLRGQPANRMVALVSLWLFTVIAPATTAFRMHRRLNELIEGSPEVPDAVVRELAIMRSLLLIFGTMATLSAFTLLLGR